MKVLHLPQNIASQIAVTVQALRELGLQARGMVTADSVIQDSEGLEILPRLLPSPRDPLGLILRLPARTKAVFEAIRWADVVHWHYSRALPGGLDVRYAARLGKPGLVEFWGDDIRIPRIAAADNPYMARMYAEHPEIGKGAAKRSGTNQRLFAGQGMACLIPGPGLLAHVDRSLFPEPLLTRQRLALDDYRAAFPDPGKERPLVVHMPSDKARKGTDAVLQAVESLGRTHRFDFRLLHGVKRSEAMKVLQSCDILLDQFVAGEHGLAALESMAFGKPTICYITPSLVKDYPEDCPLVVADQEEIGAALKGLLEDRRRRYEIGRRSRAYVEKYHDSRLLAKQLINIYETLKVKRRQRRR